MAMGNMSAVGYSIVRAAACWSSSRIAIRYFPIRFLRMVKKRLGSFEIGGRIQHACCNTLSLNMTNTDGNARNLFGWYDAARGIPNKHCSFGMFKTTMPFVPSLSTQIVQHAPNCPNCTVSE